MKLIPVSSWIAAPIAIRSAPIVITFAMTMSSTAGVATRAPYVVRRTVARSVFVTWATLADICMTTISIGVDRSRSQFCAKPAVAPTTE